ncbi:hypothetical protein [Streptomyces luteogriseus]|uniref:hypothetical protein n=1 Tax=Streptomyces luteogriseus TaxID=68233 RepID=UPI003814F8FE
MKWWPFVLRSQYDNARAEADRQRDRADNAMEREETALFNRRQISRHLSEAQAENLRWACLASELGVECQRLAGRNKELEGQVRARGAGARLEERLVRALRATARILAAYWAEKARADHLQRRLDDAVGLHHGGRISDSRTWQPGYRKPKEDAS